MKRYILGLLLAILTLWASAVPALRIRRIVTLDDGRTVMVTAYGNEDFDYLVSDDGEVIIAQDTVFFATGLTREEYFASIPQKPLYARQRVGSVASALVKPWGKKKIPVILAAFKDKKFTIAATDEKVNAFYDDFFNGTKDYTATGTYDAASNLGCVRQYFIDQSQGQFEPDFTIIGPVDLDSVYSYYGGDRNANNKDTCYSKFVEHSFTKALAQHENWSEFDNDGDGDVDMCVIIFAGLGQNYTNSYGDKSTIWPQERPSSYTINGKKLSGCTSSCEMRPLAAENGRITAWHADGIGVVVHELSHALGLPDFYDTKSVAFGLDYWSIMDYGMYTRQAKVPVGYTAYEREFMGWQQTEVIDGPRTLRLYPLARGGKGYKLVNDANPNEYYILDNRQAESWDWGLCSNRGHGMLVYHVDFNQGVWNLNNVNVNPSHQYLTIIPANNTLIGSNNATSSDQWKTSLLGNPYPGLTENHELTDETVPASTVFKGGLMSKPLVDIEETEDGVIIVKAMPLGTLDAPTGLTFEDSTPGSTIAVWEPVEEAEFYNLQLWREGKLVMEQDSIATNSFRLDDLQADVDYSFAVQAISDAYRNSNWTESETFRIDPDAISEITESGELVRIYSINGRFVGECFADQLRRFSLRHGIFVVKHANGKIKKLTIQ